MGIVWIDLIDRSKQGSRIVPKAAGALDEIRLGGIVPVFHSDHLDAAKCVARSVVASGLDVFEFTNRGAGALELAARLIEWAGKEQPSLMIGVGTVMDASSASRAIGDGSRFVFAPSFSAEVAELCARYRVAYIPGCATVTEIQTAFEAGCEVVKLFPADSLGALLDSRPLSEAVEIGAAHGALVMTTPGDTSMVTRSEVERAVSARSARVVR